MAVTAEMKVGRRSVMSYFLYPLLRGLDESIREYLTRVQRAPVIPEGKFRYRRANIIMPSPGSTPEQGKHHYRWA